MTYSEALEKRVQWITSGPSEFYYKYGPSAITNFDNGVTLYDYGLKHGETYFMNKHFATVVDHARRSVPDDLEFDTTWLVTKAGWMWVEEPFQLPRTAMQTKKGLEASVTVSAVAWFPHSGGTQVLFFTDDMCGKYLMWSYMNLEAKAVLGPRIERFENDTNDPDPGSDQVPYVDGPESKQLHELRWFYTAMHLMSQKMTVTHTQPAERGTRRRLEKKGLGNPPPVRVVSLRRLEEDRKKDPCGHHVDWKWHWSVTGHWRNQYCPSDKSHKTIWIESYVKGDMHKPFKSTAHTIYMVKR